MTLTLCQADKTVRIDIDPHHFKRLRDPDVRADEIEIIALQCGVDASLLSSYADDMKKTVKENLELDGSCDYSDHL